MYFQDSLTMKRKYLESKESISIYQAFRKGKLVLFIGSGFTANFGSKMWGESLKTIIDKVKLLDDVVGDKDKESYLDQLKASSTDPRIKLSLLGKFTNFLENKYELYQVINDTFIKSRSEVFSECIEKDKILKDITDYMSVLNLNYLTTNFDNILEIITGIKKSLDFKDIENIKEPSDIKQGILHLHGYLNDSETNSDISEKLTFDYISYIKQYYIREKSLLNKILSLDEETVFLFLGSSMTEIEIINTIYSKKGKRQNRFIAIKGFDDSMDFDINVEFYKDFEIDILGYEIKDNSHRLFKNLLQVILSELSSKQTPQQNIDMMSRIEVSNVSHKIKQIILDVDKYDFHYSKKLIDNIQTDGLFYYFDKLGIFNYQNISSNYMYFMNYLIEQIQNEKEVDMHRIKEIIKNSFNGIKNDSRYYSYFNNRLNKLLLLSIDQFSLSELKDLLKDYNRMEPYLFDEDLVDSLIKTKKIYRLVILDYLVDGIVKSDYTKLAYSKINKDEVFESLLRKINSLGAEKFTFLSARELFRYTHSFERKLFKKIVNFIIEDKTRYNKNMFEDKYVELKVLFALFYKDEAYLSIINDFIDDIDLVELINNHRFYSELKDYFYAYKGDTNKMKAIIEKATYDKVSVHYQQVVKNNYIQALFKVKIVLENEINMRLAKEFERETSADILEEIKEISSVDEVMSYVSQNKQREFNLRESIKDEIVNKIENNAVDWKSLHLNIFDGYFDYYFDVLDVIWKAQDFDNDFEIIRWIEYIKSNEKYDHLWRLNQYIKDIMENNYNIKNDTAEFIMNFITESIYKFDTLFGPIKIKELPDDYVYIPGNFSYLLNIYLVMYGNYEWKINFLEFDDSFKDSKDFWYYFIGYMAQFNSIDYLEDTVTYYRNLDNNKIDLFLKGYISRNSFRIHNPFEKECIAQYYAYLKTIAISDYEVDVISNLYFVLFQEKEIDFNVEDVIDDKRIVGRIMFNFQDFITDDNISQLIDFLNIVTSSDIRINKNILNRLLFIIDNLDMQLRGRLMKYLHNFMEKMDTFKESYLGYHIFNTLKNVNYEDGCGIDDVKKILKFIMTEMDIEVDGLSEYKKHLRNISFSRKKEITDILSEGRFSYIEADKL